MRSLQGRLDEQEDRVVVETAAPRIGPPAPDVPADGSEPAFTPAYPAPIGPQPLPSVTDSADVADGQTPDPPGTATFGAALTHGGVRFAQPGDGRHEISVAGDFNHWSATSTPLRFDERRGAHEVLVEIPPGRYRYRLVIDGSWKADPFNKHKQVNEYGELNSVLVVPDSQDTS